MRWIKKTRSKLFRLADPGATVSFFDWIRQSENLVGKSFFSTAQESQSRKKFFFFLRKKARFGLQSKKAVFDRQIRLY